MSFVDVENIAILSLTLFSDFSSLFRQLIIGRCLPNVADLKCGFTSPNSSLWNILRGTNGATIAVAFVTIGGDFTKSIVVPSPTEPLFNTQEKRIK